MYKLKKKRTNKSIGRISIIRNVWEIQYREPYATYHINLDNGEYYKVHQHINKDITYYSPGLPELIQKLGFEDVEAFAESKLRHFDGYYELIEKANQKESN